MDEMMEWVAKHKWRLFCVLAGTSVLHGFIGLARELPVSKAAAGAAGGIVLFFVTWGMVFIVLGVQAVNPLCSKRLFGGICRVVFAWGILATALCILSDTVFSLPPLRPKFEPVALAPACFGFVCATVFLYKKYYLGCKEILAEQAARKPTDLRNTIIRCGTVCALIVAFFVAIYGIVREVFLRSEPFKHSIMLVEKNDEAVEYLGIVQTRPKLISGSLKAGGNGAGNAAFSYRLKGTGVSAHVSVNATKEAGVWHYEDITLYKDMADGGEAIDLLAPVDEEAASFMQAESR